MKVIFSLALLISSITCYAVAPVEKHVVRINSTLQKWSAAQPWDKSAPAKDFTAPKGPERWVDEIGKFENK